MNAINWELAHSIPQTFASIKLSPRYSWCHAAKWAHVRSQPWSLSASECSYSVGSFTARHDTYLGTRSETIFSILAWRIDGLLAYSLSLYKTFRSGRYSYVRWYCLLDFSSEIGFVAPASWLIVPSIPGPPFVYLRAVASTKIVPSEATPIATHLTTVLYDQSNP